MKTYKLNILALCAVLLLAMACKKDQSGRKALPEGSVTFDLPASTDVVTTALEIKSVSLVTKEIKATLQGEPSADIHYVTFAADTTKIADYRAKYGSSALLLPITSYLFYKTTVAIPAGAKVTEPAVLNLGVQTTLKGHTPYVLPVVIESVDGQPLDPKTRKVVYYVFNTGDPLYVDHTGYTLTATASSTYNVNVPARAIDASTSSTYWLSSPTQALPQWISIDFGRNLNFLGLDYFFPGSSIVPSIYGGFTTSAKIETSSDNASWIDRGTYAVDVNNTARMQPINLPSLTTARYLRFTILTAIPYGGNSSVGFVGGILLRN